MGLPFGLEKVEGVWLAFLGHDVETERSGDVGEKHAKKTGSLGSIRFLKRVKL
jgi:hypothetical protein